MSRLIFLVLLGISFIAEGKKIHYVHWNRASPMFRIDNTDHIVDVKEFDQVNLICPVSKPGSTSYPEKHVIYSVSREEFESCRITNPKPRIVAICNEPHKLMYFTITFRSFTPTPGGLEFKPGQDYYFISTSSREDLHRRVGGGCSTHNMKMIFKVHESPKQHQQLPETFEQEIMEQDFDAPRINTIPDGINSKVPKYTIPKAPQVINTQRESIVYYYHPRDVIAMENALNSRSEEFESEQEASDRSASHFKDVLKNYSTHLPFTSSAHSHHHSSLSYVNLILFVTLLFFFTSNITK